MVRSVSKGHLQDTAQSFDILSRRNRQCSILVFHLNSSAFVFARTERLSFLHHLLQRSHDIMKLRPVGNQTLTHSRSNHGRTRAVAAIFASETHLHRCFELRNAHLQDLGLFSKHSTFQTDNVQKLVRVAVVLLQKVPSIPDGNNLLKQATRYGIGLLVAPKKLSLHPRVQLLEAFHHSFWRHLGTHL